MKLKFILLTTISLLLCSCNKIPKQSIFEAIDTKELASIIKKDTLFIPFYEFIQEETEDFNEIEKARFNDITYRKLYSMVEYTQDTTKLNPLCKKWGNEWEEQFSLYDAKADSVIQYWQNCVKNNSLDRFVKIEFAAIDKDYYGYFDEVKDVNFAFKLTPLQGKIEQIRFNYRYTAKINDIQYAEKHNCISTSPFSKPIVRYWEVGYSDEKRLKNLTSSDFKRDYNIAFEITEIRKDGVNYSVDDLEIPKSIASFFDIDTLRFPLLYQLYKDDAKRDIISEEFCIEYQTKSEFIENKVKQLAQKKFPKEVAFMDYIYNR